MFPFATSTRQTMAAFALCLGAMSGAFACTSTVDDAGFGEGSGGSSSAAGGSLDGSGSGGTSGTGGGTITGSGSVPGAGGESAEDGVDAFGITELYPSAASFAEWTSVHWTGTGPYSIDGEIDAADPLGISGKRGTGTLEVSGTGELVMGGSEPRLYIYPGDGGPWRDLEATVYYQRVQDDGTAYAGLVVGARSGPDGHNTATACDAHTYYARLRHDGGIDFEKELKHPASSAQSSVDPEEVWPPTGELPTGQWIGWKFVVYNLSASTVQLEAYRDLSEGQDGGDWQLMNEMVDDGGWFVDTDCAEHAPTGGESDLIVLDGGAVLVRNSNVTEARYRWLSIREIAP